MRRMARHHLSVLIGSSVAALFLLLTAGAPRVWADPITVGGVTYNYIQEETDSPNVYDVQLTIDTTGAISSETLSSFAVQFTGATSVTLESASDGSWTGEGMGPNDSTGCNINGSANHWCFDTTSGLPVPDGVYTFTFDVTMPDGIPLPSDAGIMAFQGTPLAVSTSFSIPEPSSILLLGIGLVGLVGLALSQPGISPASEHQ